MRAGATGTTANDPEMITMATDLDTDDFFKSRFFKAASDLGEEGAQLLVTIKTVNAEKVGRDKKENCPILEFTDDGVKPLVLNKTNWTTIRNAFGPPANWEGKKVILVAKNVEYGADTVLGTRVKIPPKKTAEDLNDTVPY
jgi:hypothetical protein